MPIGPRRPVLTGDADRGGDDWRVRWRASSRPRDLDPSSVVLPNQGAAALVLAQFGAHIVERRIAHQLRRHQNDAALLQPLVGGAWRGRRRLRRPSGKRRFRVALANRRPRPLGAQTANGFTQLRAGAVVGVSRLDSSAVCSLSACSASISSVGWFGGHAASSATVASATSAIVSSFSRAERPRRIGRAVALARRVRGGRGQSSQR